MINLKTLILIIILLILVGVTLIFVSNFTHSNNLTTQQFTNQTVPLTPTPLPTLTPINENSNLKEEIKKLTPEDFSKDFDNLKQTLWHPTLLKKIITLKESLSNK